MAQFGLVPLRHLAFFGGDRMKTTAPIGSSQTYSAYENVQTFTSTYSHAPTFNVIDLDYPMYGTTVVKCGGRKFDLEVVKKALALVADLTDFYDEIGF